MDPAFDMSQPIMRDALGAATARRYGKYLLVKKLAEGGMAEIFLAKQLAIEGFEKNVVVKRMLPSLTEVGDFVSMFLDEARLAAGLAHPNIVHISDLGFADGCYYICMEYLAGEDLAAVLRAARRAKRVLPWEAVLRIVAEAGKGLHFAHEALAPDGTPLGLVHRDVSPSNLFVTYAGQVKVLDFGVAKATSSAVRTEVGVVKGKFQYMPPEQARGERVDRRCDVYSLGVTLYEALTLSRPFARDTELAVIKAVLEGEFTPLDQVRPDLPASVVAIVARAMHRDGAARFQSALELVNAIEALIGGATADSVHALSGMLAGLFDAERIRGKTRIQTMAELGASLQRPDTGVTTQPAGQVSPTEKTAVVPPPAAARRRGMGVVGTLAAIVGLVGAGGLAGAAWQLMSTGRGTAELDAGAAPVVAIATPPPPVVAAPEDAGAEPADAGPALPPPTPKPARPGKVTEKPVRLTETMVREVLAQGRKRYTACFAAHRADLPSARGTLVSRITIAGSGEVREVDTSLPGTDVSRCVTKVLRSLRFPRHLDGEVALPFNLEYDVRPAAP